MLFPVLAQAPDWSLKYERSGYVETGRYSEAVDYCRRLAKASPNAKVVTYGKSPQGRDMIALLISSEHRFDAGSLAKSKRPLVFIQNGIHAGEIEGKDASLMLARDLLITGKQKALAEGANFLIVPIFNVDGHERFGPYNRINQNGPKEMGWRSTAQNFNLNRDWTKADAPEMRAQLRLIHRFRPDFFFDNHTTDGADYPYVLTLSVPNSPLLPPRLAEWQTKLYAAVKPLTDRDGFLTAPYLGLVDDRDYKKGVRIEDFGPRYSHGYWGALNRPSMLVETHVLKPYRARVDGTYSVMVRTIQRCIADSANLKAMNAALDQDEVQGNPYSVLSARPTNESHPFTFVGYPFTPYTSEVSGGTIRKWDRSQTVTVETKSYDIYAAGPAVTPPAAYAVPPQWQEVIEKLGIHGLQGRTLRKPLEGDFDTYNFTDVTFATSPFEGRFQPRFTVQPVRQHRELPTGTLILPVRQVGARLLMHLLEPDAGDSFARWGLFNSIFEQKEYYEEYAMEPIAKQMLERDPALRAQFEAKIAAEPTFAKSPRERLRWLFEHSLYVDDRLNAYPVVKLSEADLKRIGR